jgi:hypothetical protein
MEKWEKEVILVKENQRQLDIDARLKYQKDLKAIEDQNAYITSHAQEIYEIEIEKIKTRNATLLLERETHQSEIEAKAFDSNKIAQLKYEDDVEIKNVKSDFDAKCLATTMENSRLSKEVQDEFDTMLEEVTHFFLHSSL